jgi:predicted aldo/keto reductase-like oxidoreductase
LETFLKARREGLIRYIGFSAHTEEAALAVMDRFEFDSVLFPFNWTSWLKNGFGPKVLEKAESQGMGRLALKALAKRKWKKEEEKKWPKCWYAPVDDPQEADLALRFALSLPITAAVSPSHMGLLEWACDVADQFTPIKDEEVEQLKAKSRDLDPIFPGGLEDDE